MMGSDYYDDNRYQDVPSLGVGDGGNRNAIIVRMLELEKEVFLVQKVCKKVGLTMKKMSYVRDGIIIVMKNVWFPMG